MSQPSGSCHNRHNQFDVFNILTEASTHYGRNDLSDKAVQMGVNRIMFDQFKSKVVLNPTMPESSESDPSRAFFGKD